MGWLILGLRPAGDRGVRSDSKEVWEHRSKSECPSRTPIVVARIRPKTEVPALMKVLIGVDPHKGSVAIAVVDEAMGELVERASFLHNRAGLRALQRWAKRFPERRWAVENAGGLGRHLAGRLAAAGESVVDVPPKLSAQVRVLSTGNARKNDGLDALATALAASRNERLAAVDPEADSEVLRLLSERREDLVAERARALKAACTGFYETSSPAG
jgi:transposase